MTYDLILQFGMKHYGLTILKKYGKEKTNTQASIIGCNICHVVLEIRKTASFKNCDNKNPKQVIEAKQFVLDLILSYRNF